MPSELEQPANDVAARKVKASAKRGVRVISSPPGPPILVVSEFPFNSELMAHRVGSRAEGCDTLNSGSISGDSDREDGDSGV